MITDNDKDDNDENNDNKMRRNIAIEKLMMTIVAAASTLFAGICLLNENLNGF